MFSIPDFQNMYLDLSIPDVQHTSRFLYKKILSEENQTQFCKAQKLRKCTLKTKWAQQKQEHAFKKTDPF